MDTAYFVRKESKMTDIFFSYIDRAKLATAAWTARNDENLINSAFQFQKPRTASSYLSSNTIFEGLELDGFEDYSQHYVINIVKTNCRESKSKSKSKIACSKYKQHHLSTC